ncbi:MAG: glycosyltransferase [Terriglobales bacterium]
MNAHPHQIASLAALRAPPAPRVSILINNYNYAGYLGQAIDSALAQDYSNIEVIVVDDGSTDGSRDVITSYGDRIVAVLQENGGQGSAFNTGFRHSTGDLVCFLDADDVFLPNKASSLMAEYRGNREAVLFYHRLQLVDGDLRPQGNPWPRSVWRGNIRRRVEQSGTWWPRPTTSGLCATRAFLQIVLPMPPAPYRLCADSYISGLAPFFGQVVGIREPLALYRIHNANYYNARAAGKRHDAERRLQRVEVEFRELCRALHDQFAINALISIDDNMRYQQFRMLAGQGVSHLQVLWAIARTPTLPLPMKLRELAKVVLGRT